MQTHDDILFVRAQELKGHGMTPYAKRFSRSHSLFDINETYEGVGREYEMESVSIRVSGRVMLVDDDGHKMLVMIEDQDSQMQLVLLPAYIAKSSLAQFRRWVYRGDYLGFEVDCIYREGDYITGRVIHWHFLALALLPIPMVMSAERQRHEHLMYLTSNFEARERLATSSRMLRYLRQQLEQQGFLEMNTFHLQALMAAGFEQVYTMIPAPQSEGADWLKHPKARVLTCCIAFADVSDGVMLIEQWFLKLAQYLNATSLIPWWSLDTLTGAAPDRETLYIDLANPWSQRTMRELIMDILGVDFSLAQTLEAAIHLARSVGFPIEDMENWHHPDEVIKAVFQQFVQPFLIQPTIVIDRPDQTDQHSECFTLYINGIEFARGYMGSTDPLEVHIQQRLSSQPDVIAEKSEANKVLETSLIYGTPPFLSLTLFIDRLAMLMTCAQNIQDVICFSEL